MHEVLIFFDAAAKNIIGLENGSLGIDPEFWNNKQGNPSNPFRCTLYSSQDQMNDILCQVMLSP